MKNRKFLVNKTLMFKKKQFKTNQSIERKLIVEGLTGKGYSHRMFTIDAVGLGENALEQSCGAEKVLSLYE